MTAVEELCRLCESRGLITNARRFAFYLETVFERLRFDRARVLDVGSGNGIVSCYAALKGAASVVALEPEGAGSVPETRRDAVRIAEEMGLASKIDVRNETIEAFDAREGEFDVVILHNAINHLDESACMRLGTDPRARATYLALLDRLARVTRPGAQLFVSDCSPRNVFPALGWRNPFAKDINWRKHQSPEQWVALLRQLGFDEPVIAWTPINRLLAPGKRLTGNRFVAYFATSHFYLTMVRQ